MTTTHYLLCGILEGNIKPLQIQYFKQSSTNCTTSQKPTTQPFILKKKKKKGFKPQRQCSGQNTVASIQYQQGLSKICLCRQCLLKTVASLCECFCCFLLCRFVRGNSPFCCSHRFFNFSTLFYLQTKINVNFSVNLNSTMSNEKCFFRLFVKCPHVKLLDPFTLSPLYSWYCITSWQNVLGNSVDFTALVLQYGIVYF